MRIDRRLLSLWLPVALWMAAIFFGSSQQSLPTPQSNVLDVLVKKTGHMLEYGLLSLLLWRACYGSLQPATDEKTGSPATQAMPANPGLVLPSIVTVVLGVLYAVTDELHQLYVPTRSGNARDVVIDATAVSLAVILMLLWRRSRSHSPRQP